ncbi:RNA polymerase sigma factor [Leptospira sp. GIMC2001]|uniref:RNA polymerase sigma factor n=1 Tax=Leptospira sp. GIMC2001 TaxID=1513297 RepID=UPI0004A5C38E|nr:RNA polymerase sigma factor [Leptospira sp. GIMC2001]AID56261.1 RNA polymerase sigma-54 factor RpoN [Leptospira sp. GIMC2001]WCL49477.1 RNA polymerase sigma factor [Leptospira sp. GIMC2001]
MNSFQDPLIPLLEKCLAGDHFALEGLVDQLQPKIFSMALHFLWSPEDAEDACQEILVKVITKLESFRRESKLSTWVYKIAVNHLIQVKRSKLEESKIRFKYIDHELRNSQHSSAALDEESDISLYIRGACTYAILHCLKRTYRIVFVMGIIFGMSSEEGAYILEITPVNFRKRLSRSRKMMSDFMKPRCGLLDSSNACKCKNRIKYSNQSPQFNSFLNLSMDLKKSWEWNEIEPSLDESKEILAIANLFRSTPDFQSKKKVMDELKRLILRNQFDLFKETNS